jgi:MFS family permease
MPASIPPHAGVQQGHDAYGALREPAFVRYLAGNVLSTFGQQMLTFAVSWEVYERTNSKLALGWIGLVQVVPVVGLALPAGQVADRYDRKRVLTLSMLLAALASSGLALVSYLGGAVGWIYAALFVIGVSRAFQGPSKGAMLPQVVSRERFENAVTWNSGGWQLAAVLGPAAGGGIVALMGRAADVYVLAAATALAFALLLAGVTLAPVTRAAAGATVGALAEGLRFVFRQKLVLATITLDLFAVLLGGAVALLPVFAKDVLHVGPGGLGLLRAADSAGAVMTALLLAHRPPLRRAGPTLLWAVAGFGASIVVFGLSRSYPLSLLALFMTGAFDSVSVVVRSTIVPLVTPEHMRGRVSAVNNMFISTSNEFGAFESAAVASWIGAVPSVVVGGIGTIVVVAFVAVAWPSVRRLRSLADVVVEPDGT